jgi:hypothetical protein
MTSTDQGKRDLSWLEQRDAALRKIPSASIDAAETLLIAPALIRQTARDIRAIGIRGETKLALALYLIGTSRLLEEPLHGIIRGSSSTGKSYTLERVSMLFPDVELVVAHDITPQALYYLPQGYLKHRFVVKGERTTKESTAAGEATKALRELMSSGFLNKIVTIRNESVRICQEGPIAFLETSTVTRLFDEDENRRVVLFTDHDERQTRRIMRGLARRYSGKDCHANGEQVRIKHQALQLLLEPKPVTVPFADALLARLPDSRVEMRRVARQLLGAIQASALLHQRRRFEDGKGRIVATIEDYQLVKTLFGTAFERPLGVQLSPSIRKFLIGIMARFGSVNQFTTKDAAREEEVSERCVREWLQELSDAGLLKRLELGRGGRTSVWTVEPYSRKVQLLPETDQLRSSADV